MKNLFIMLGACILIMSCGSNHVVSDNLIQKRKYRKGYFVANKAQSKATPVKSQEKTPSLSPISVEEITLSNDPSKEIASVEKKEGASMVRFNKTMERIESLSINGQPVGRFIPFDQTKSWINKKALKSKGNFKEDHSLAAYLGFSLGIMSIISVFTAIVTVETGAIGLVFFFLAVAIAITDLILSIMGMTESFRDDKKGKALGIIGSVLNGIIAIAGLLIVIIFVGIWISCSQA